MSTCCTFDASPPPLKSSAVQLTPASKAVLGCAASGAFNPDVCTKVLKGTYGACPALAGQYGQTMTSAASYACACDPRVTPFCSPAPALKLAAQPRGYSDAGMLFKQWLGSKQLLRLSASATSSSDNLQGRFENFVHSLRLIDANNGSGRSSVVLGLNHLADRSPLQMRRRLGYKKDPNASLLADFRLTAAAGPVAPPPAWFDWSLHGVVGDTVDQGDCGSCFIFSTVAAMEAAYARKSGKYVKFSEQAIINAYAGIGKEKSLICDTGGDPSTVLKSFRGYFIPAADEPHTAGTGCQIIQDCRRTYSACPTLVKVGDDFVDCPNVFPKKPLKTAYPWAKTGLTKTVTFASSKKTNLGMEVDIMNFLINNGPLIACVEATTWPKEYATGVLQTFAFDQGFQVGSKVYRGTHDWAQITSQAIGNTNHAVLLIGYGTTPAGADYWIIRNSYGTGWGMQGAVWIPRVGRMKDSEARYPTGPFCMYSEKFVIPV